MEEDILQEMNKDTYQDIIVSLEKDAPVTLGIINLLKGFDTEDKTKETDLRVFCPKGESSSGVFIVVLTYLNKCRYRLIKMYSNEENVSKLEEALIKTTRLDWCDANVFVEGLFYKILPVLESVFKVTNISSIDKNKYISMFLPYEALHDVIYQEVIVPEGFLIRPLTSEDAKLVDYTWAYHSETSYDYIHHSITFFGGVGLALKHTGHLVSWAVGVWNTIGMVHTMPDHRHRGYAEVVVKTLAKKLNTINVKPMCMIRFDNAPSLRLFKKLGFLEVGLYYCIGLQ